MMKGIRKIKERESSRNKNNMKKSEKWEKSSLGINYKKGKWKEKGKDLLKGKLIKQEIQ